MSGKCDDDELARMAGLGPLAESSSPEVEEAVEEAAETETPPTKVAAPASEEPASQVMISFREALVIIGVSRNTLYSLLGRKVIPGVRKLGGTWRFHRQTLLDWLACK